MRRAVLVILAGLLLCGQSPIRNFPPGMFQSRAPLDAGAATTFTGAGDLGLSATVQAYWALRAWTSATRGNKVANICNVADVVCGDVNSDPTTGIMADPTIGGVLCGTTAGVNVCTIKTIYDQSGQTNCTSAVCDLTQATIAKRPTLIPSSSNGLPCMQFTASSSQDLVNSANFNPVSTTQPFTVSYVAKRTGATAAIGNVIESAAIVQFGFFGSANTIFEYAGTVASLGSIADNSFHAVQNILNGASSVIYVDGASNAVSAGASTWVNPISMGGNTGSGNFLTGCVTEVSIWHGGFSGGDNSSMNTNQRSASSGWNF